MTYVCQLPVSRPRGRSVDDPIARDRLHTVHSCAAVSSHDSQPVTDGDLCSRLLICDMKTSMSHLAECMQFLRGHNLLGNPPHPLGT